MTHRQYLAWQRWLACQRNIPSQESHYLMQLMWRMEGLLHKVGKFDIDKYHLHWGNKYRTPPSAEQEERQNLLHLQAWISHLGKRPVLLNRETGEPFTPEEIAAYQSRVDAGGMSDVNPYGVNDLDTQ